MASISSPSNFVFSLDIPEVKNFSATFVYNFFVPNESTTIAVEEVRGVFPYNIPRFVHLNWDFAEIFSGNVTLKVLQDEGIFINTQTFQEFSSKIVDENQINSFISSKYLLKRNIRVFDSKLGNININPEAFNKNSFRDSVELEIQNDGFILSEEDIPPQNDSSEHDSLESDSGSASQQGFKQNFATIGSFVTANLSTQLSPVIATKGSVIDNITENLQTQTLNEDSVEIRQNDISDLIGIDNIILSRSGINVDGVSNSVVIGFEIQQLDLNTQEIKKFFIQNNNFVDKSVKYNQNLSYRMRTISIIELKVKNENDQDSTVCFLVGSKFTNDIEVVIKENERPEHPQDFRINFDGQLKKPILTWSLANNKQRDVKKVQVFKRLNTESPFELIKIYDFDNSEIKYIDLDFNELIEQIKESDNRKQQDDERLIKFNNEPVLRHIDKKFDLNETAIYALRSVDAHGMSSDYSTQIMVKYDRNKKKLINTLISRAGAPKNYPNLFIDNGKPELPRDFRVISRAKEIEICFDPDIFTYKTNINGQIDEKNVIRPLLDKFIVNLINVDNKKSSQVTIDIK